MLRSSLRDKCEDQEFNGVFSFHFHKVKGDEEKENKLGLIKSFALSSQACSGGGREGPGGNNVLHFFLQYVSS